MRNILFRGKRLDTCAWTYGYVDATMYKDIVVIHTDNGTHQVDINTVGQYTGFTDKDGNKIFEDDILNVYGRPAVVRYSAVYAMFRLDSLSGFHYLFSDLDEDATVIGNFHDNQELLKEDNK
jgi:hypothetical protein